MKPSIGRSTMADIPVVTAVKILSVESGTIEDARLAFVALAVGQPVSADDLNNFQWVVADALTQKAAGQFGVGLCLEAVSPAGDPQVSRFGARIQLTPGGMIAGELYVVSANSGRIAPIGDLVTGNWITEVGRAESPIILRFEPRVTQSQLG